MDNPLVFARPAVVGCCRHPTRTDTLQCSRRAHAERFRRLCAMFSDVPSATPWARSRSSRSCSSRARTPAPATGRAPAADPNDLVGVVWVLDRASMVGSWTDVPPGAQVTLTFEDGQAHGSAACNSYGGAYRGGRRRFAVVRRVRGHADGVRPAPDDARDGLPRGARRRVGVRGRELGRPQPLERRRDVDLRAAGHTRIPAARRDDVDPVEHLLGRRRHERDLGDRDHRSCSRPTTR